MTTFPLAHVPPQELQLLLYTLEAAANDLNSRAAMMNLGPQGISSGGEAAQRESEDEKKLMDWKQRLSEQTPFSSDELHALVAFLMDLAYHQLPRLRRPMHGMHRKEAGAFVRDVT